MFCRKHSEGTTLWFERPTMPMNSRILAHLKCPIAAATLGLFAPCAFAGHNTAAAQAIRDLQKAYRAQPVCERIAIQVRAPASSSAALAKVGRAAMVLRMEL